MARDLSNIMLDTVNWKRPLNYYVPLNNELLQNYVGEFQLDDKLFTISIDKGQLYGQLHHYPKVPYLPNSTNEFFCRYFDGILKFNKIGGKVNSLEYAYKGKPEIYIRQN